jgi:hypothetical protein
MEQNNMLSTGDQVPGLCVNSMAELKALKAGTMPCLTVLGCSDPGDGGGGCFYWDATATQSDNRGTIIAPTSTPQNQPGRWKRLVTTPVNPKWWGAKGDGITIDTAAFQAMIHATTTPGGPGPHYDIPAGSYAIDQTLLFDGLAGGLVTGNSSGPFWVGGFDTTYQNPIPAIHIRNSQFMVWQNIGISRIRETTCRGMAAYDTCGRSQRQSGSHLYSLRCSRDYR